MKVVFVLAFSLLSFVVAPAATANRVACIGSNEARALANGLASGDQLTIASLPTLLDEISAKTGTKLFVFQVFEQASVEARNEYQLIDRNDRYRITLTEISSTKVKLTAERACQSETADGWESGWKSALTLLQQHGFSFE
jgi:hypothetical protein